MQPRHMPSTSESHNITVLQGDRMGPNGSQSANGSQWVPTEWVPISPGIMQCNCCQALLTKRLLNMRRSVTITAGLIQQSVRLKAFNQQDYTLSYSPTGSRVLVK